MIIAQFGEFFAAGAMHPGHPLEKHLHELVASAALRVVMETEQKGDPFGGRHLLGVEIIEIEGLGLRSQVQDLCWQNMGKQTQR